MIVHRGLDKMYKAPEEQMHILFRFDSLNVIKPLQTQPWHTLSYCVYSYHPKSTGNKIKYFIRLLFGCCAAGTERSPLPQTSCRKVSEGWWGGRPEQLGGLPHSLPTPRQGPRPSPQSPAQLSSPSARSFLPHLDSWEAGVGNGRGSLHFSEVLMGAGLLGKNQFVSGSGRELGSVLLSPCPFCPARQVFSLLTPESRGCCLKPLARSWKSRCTH